MMASMESISPFFKDPDSLGFNHYLKSIHFACRLGNSRSSSDFCPIVQSSDQHLHRRANVYQHHICVIIFTKCFLCLCPLDVLCVPFIQACSFSAWRRSRALWRGPIFSRLPLQQQIEEAAWDGNEHRATYYELSPLTGTYKTGKMSANIGEAVRVAMTSLELDLLGGV